MDNLNVNIAQDIESVSRIKVIPLILEAVCRITGMGFSAVARVTPEQWIACGVHDDIKFGLRVGGELKVDTTICHEIRQNGTEVVIDHVNEDQFYHAHHTPAMYGFQSYISIPLSRQDGRFFGTLCAIDPSPAILRTPEIIGVFKAYAGLISLLIHASEQFPAAVAVELENQSIQLLNRQLESMVQQGLYTKGEDQATAPVRRGTAYTDNIKQAVLEVTELTAGLKETA